MKESCLSIQFVVPFRHVIMDPEFQPGSSRMPALARSVHFFQAGQSVMVSYLDARVMSVLTSHVW